MKYFKHDLTARDDDKIFELIEAHGMQGYGVWWVLLEELYKVEEQGFQLEVTETWFKRLSKQLNLTDWRTLIRILDTMAEHGLIDSQLWAEHVIFAPGMAKRADQYIKAKQAAAERKRKQRESPRAQVSRVTPVGQPQSHNTVTTNTDPDPDPDPDPDLNLSLSSDLYAPEEEKKSKPRERGDALPVQNLPQGLFPYRSPIAVAVTPTFQGPWGVGCTPEQERFDQWLQSEARKKGMRDPSAYAFKVIDSIAKGGPTGKWAEFLASTGQAPGAPDPTAEWADELRRRLAKDHDHTMVGRSWCNEVEGQERTMRRQFLSQFLEEYLHAKQAS